MFLGAQEKNEHKINNISQHFLLSVSSIVNQISIESLKNSHFI